MYVYIYYRNFFCGTNAGNPERARCSLLTRSGSQSEYRISVQSRPRFCVIYAECSILTQNEMIVGSY